MLVMTGMIGLAWRQVGRLSERTQLLRSLQGALSYLEEELVFRYAPLPKLLEHLSQSRTGAAGRFFRTVLAGIGDENDLSLRESWTRAARETLPLLGEEERGALEELGEVLGQYDVQSQAQALRMTGKRFAEAYTQARMDRQRLGKVYLALGVAGGLVTVLVLI